MRQAEGRCAALVACALHPRCSVVSPVMRALLHSGLNIVSKLNRNWVVLGDVTPNI